jgi:hypothetical protein
VATLSVRAIVNNCLGKAGTLSVRRDVLGVFADDNPQTRSLRERLELIQNKPFVKVLLVTISGAAPNLQRDLDTGNTIWQQECDAWVYCVDSITVDRPNLLVLDQTDCCCVGADPDHQVSTEEDELFNIRKPLGPNIVGYYIRSSNQPVRGCASHPDGRRGFWVDDSATQWSWVHELTHVVGDNNHVEDSDNLLFEDGTASITKPPPDLTSSQCARIKGDPDMESC